MEGIEEGKGVRFHALEADSPFLKTKLQVTIFLSLLLFLVSVSTSRLSRETRWAPVSLIFTLMFLSKF